MLDLIARYGYALLVVLIGLESFGIPLPGETALVTAGALAARGHLNIVAVIVAAAAGAIIGDNCGYWLGRKGGIVLVRRFGRRVGLTETKLLRVHRFFEEHGPKTVFIGRFIALLRSWAAALAGVGEMPYGTFSLYNALGGIAWATVFGVLGYVFGHNMPLLERYIARFSIGLLVLVAGGVALFLWRRRRTADATA
ncbi:MAG: DedA family protein [Gemmatimonadaceae bacterium]